MKKIEIKLCVLKYCYAYFLPGSCDYEDGRFHLASRYILKMGEHTYGLDGLGDNVNWTNAMFAKAQHGELDMDDIKVLTK